jgi:hypothetical protein
MRETNILNICRILRINKFKFGICQLQMLSIRWFQVLFAFCEPTGPLKWKKSKNNRKSLFERVFTPLWEGLSLCTSLNSENIKSN